MYKLLLAIPLLFSLTAAADTIDYSAAGNIADGTAHVTGSLTVGHTWAVLEGLIEINNQTTGQVEQGNLGSVDVVTGTLSKCAQGLCFTGGDLDIRSSSGSLIFKQAFSSGTVTQIGGNVFLNAVLAAGATVMLESPTKIFSSDSTITLVSVTTPEPASLFLLGFGLVGLAFVKGRR